MKFIISFLITLNLYASPIQIFFESDSSEAFMLRDILIKDYQIPEDLILVKKTFYCDMAEGQGKLDLCLKKNGDLVVVSINREFVNESLKIFRAP